MSDDRSVRAWKLHDEFYIRDGDVCFLVEQNTLFRLHKYFFERESDYFRGRFKTLAGSDDGSFGQPYIIPPDVKVDEFAQFVWVWYNPNKSKETWLTMLKLATKWEFHGVRALALRQLEKLSLEPIEKITLYKEYAVESQLLLPSYVALCRSPKLPSPEEGTMLTIKTVLQIAEAREKVILRASELGCPSPSTAEAPDDLVRKIVAKTFELNLPSDVDIAGKCPAAADVVTVKEPDSTKKGKLSAGPQALDKGTTKGKK